MIIMYLNWNFFHVLNNVFGVFDSGDISIFNQLEFPSGPTQAQARVPPLLYTHKALVNTYNMSFICSGIIYHHVKQFSAPSDPTRKRII